MSKSVKYGSTPAEAKLGGGLNEALPQEQRIAVLPKKLDDGPKVNEVGGFEPASYMTKLGVIRTDR